jgi:hypothetical protein
MKKESRMFKKTMFGVLLVGTICVSGKPLPAEAQEGIFSAGAGFDFSSGDYGTSSTTDIYSFPVFGKYEIGPWIFKLTVPYIIIHGPGNVVPGVGRVNAVRGNPNAAPTTNTESGIGDVVAAVTYNVFSRGASDIVVDLTGKVKFGTADENKGLGTGENDYSAQVDVYKSFGQFTALGSVGYSILGSSDSIPLNNVFYGSVGGAYKFDNRTSGGVILDLREAASSTSGPRSEATAYVAYKFTDVWKGQAYVLKGFANGSPDYGIGANIARSF